MNKAKTIAYIHTGSDVYVVTGKGTVFVTNNGIILDKICVLECLIRGVLTVYRFDKAGFPVYRKSTRYKDTGPRNKRRRVQKKTHGDQV